MTCREAYEKIKRMTEEKIDLFRRWGFVVKEESLPLPQENKHWLILFERGSRGVLIELFESGVRLRQGSHRRFFSNFSDWNKVSNSVNKFLNKLIEDFVLSVSWNYAPQLHRKGKSLDLYRNGVLLSFTFTAGKKSWCWKLNKYERFLIASLYKTAPIVDEIACIRQPLSSNPVEAFKSIVKKINLFDI